MKLEQKQLFVNTPFKDISFSTRAFLNMPSIMKCAFNMDIVDHTKSTDVCLSVFY